MSTRSLLPLLVILALTECSKEDAPTADLDETPALGVTQTANLFTSLLAIPNREGPRPQTSRPVPHQQLDQNAPVFWQENLMSSIDKLPGITVATTTSSLQGSFGWFLETSRGRKDQLRAGSTNNTLGIEFGHSHREEDGSVHLFLPTAFSEVVIEGGWGELHANTATIAGEGSSYVMVFGPRDRQELDHIWLIVQCSYAFSTGIIP
jgi:hypothetical protein